MQQNDETQTLFRHELASFIHRAIGRELNDLLLNPKHPGECPLEIPEWVSQWGVSAEQIWYVIEFMSDRDLWQIEQGRTQDVLKSVQIKSSAKAVKKRGKRLDMNQIKKAAQAERGADLSLSDVVPSAFSEICKKIPLMERSLALQEGYKGWLPTDRYGLDGTAFIVNQGMIDQWQDEFQEVNVARALELMFDDLRLERMERPRPTTVPYWVKGWLKKHGEIVTSDEDEKISVNTEFEVDY